MSLIAYLTAQRRRALMQVVASRDELAKALREIRILRGFQALSEATLLANHA